MAQGIYKYDVLGRVIEVTDYISGDVITYQYDPMGNRIAVLFAQTAQASQSQSGGQSGGLQSQQAGSSFAAPQNSGLSNSKPVAIPDRSAGPLNRKVRVSATANDIDPDGDPLKITGIRFGPGVTASVDNEGQLITIVASAPGNHLLLYTISDGRGGEAIGTINFAVTSGETGKIGTGQSGTGTPAKGSQ